MKCEGIWSSMCTKIIFVAFRCLLCFYCAKIDFFWLNIFSLPLTEIDDCLRAFLEGRTKRKITIFLCSELLLCISSKFFNTKTYQSTGSLVCKRTARLLVCKCDHQTGMIRLWWPGRGRYSHLLIFHISELYRYSHWSSLSKIGERAREVRRRNRSHCRTAGKQHWLVPWLGQPEALAKEQGDFLGTWKVFSFCWALDWSWLCTYL